ncbi:glycosyltransferase family 4 protein [Colwellia sp. Bg11-12]|uniref:glycosyltransferase family 4 protein n=1 Tax=Colwellia sp. Bg11-12 TaxID=2759817 RepID=UPI0015F623E3|nr:glycosyltransferase family 4 protein [Colwellia sp. Bg11-12]MBA6264780.1 glycosyltransferase family 4 protein [Colwellia sp. Bg11-12]
MKIAIFVDDYLPNSTKVAAKMLSELANQYLASGHVVTVFVPDSKIQSSRNETIINGVNVVSFKNGEVKHPNKIKRAINELFLSVNAWLKLRSYFKSNHHDLIVYYSPTIFFGPIVSYLKNLWNCDSYLILRDIFPSWAVEQGHIKKNSLIHSFFTYFEIKNYQAASVIGLQSNKNKELFDFRFHNQFKTECLYNWAENVIPEIPNGFFRDQYNLKDKTIFFYGGNIGSAQDMLNLIRLATNMQKNKNAFFVFLGDGDEVDVIKNEVFRLKLDNTLVLPSVTQREYLNILSECDVGMFSLSKKHSNHNFPGKILSYIQQRKPILGSVNKGNDIINLFEVYNAGYILENGNDEQLFEAAELLLESINREILVNNAIKIIENEFSVKSAATKIKTT